MTQERRQSDTRLDLLITGQAETKEQLRSMARSLDEMRHVIRGNGKPGLSDRLLRLEYRAELMDQWSRMAFRTLFPLAIGLMGLGLVMYVRTKM